ncbi:MAG: QueT transporter family protein [Oscillospiraceae bacterium]|jgi:uncharacterized membrane protein|nr:QueT transporter family protein [Oscillospiraceae bacterium]
MQKTINRRAILFLAQAAAVAALYAGLTYAVAPLSYGALQFRVSEILCILPVLSPAAIPGLFVGCILANFGSPLGLMDVVCGSAATLLAALLTYAVRKMNVKGIPLLAPLPPVLLNGAVIGLELACLGAGDVFAVGNFTWSAYAAAGLSVAFGELVVCYAGGLPLWMLARKVLRLRD